MPNPFVHVELRTNDPEKAKAFYGKLFGWKLEDVPMGPDTYTTIDVGEGTGGGITRNPEQGGRSWWLAYVAVDNVADATKKAKSLGATIKTEATEIPNVGIFSVISDPTGALVALWTPVKR